MTLTIRLYNLEQKSLLNPEMSRYWFRKSGCLLVNITRAINHILLLFITVILITVPKLTYSQSTSEWNIFRGDPSLSGFSNAQIKTPLELKWTYQTDDAIVAGPVIGANTVFVSSIGGVVYALDLAGNLKWKFETDNSIEAPALYMEGKVYVGNLSGVLFALDAQTGKLIWKYETENQIMGSANYFYQNSKIYLVVGSYDYFLHCVDASNGKMVWKYESDNFINGAAAIADNKAMFGGCDGFLHMVSVEKGIAEHKLEVSTYIAGSVAISDNLVFTGDYDGLFSCIDLADKRIKWQFDNPSSNLPILGSPSITKDVVVIGGQDKKLRCFSKNTGNELWNFNAGGRIDASPVISGNSVIAVTMDGMLYIVNLFDGKEIWSYEIGSAMAHNPGVINNSVVVGARDGNVYYFEKK